jgi:mRNA-degrading endonuclease RelE of RelBE toxin-antitoxin system
MKNNVQLDEQVSRFIEKLSPEPKRAIRRGLKGLENEEGNIKALGEDLTGHYRLKVKNYRIIFVRENGSIIRCVFAERRDAVYERYSATIRK